MRPQQTRGQLMLIRAGLCFIGPPAIIWAAIVTFSREFRGACIMTYWTVRMEISDLRRGWRGDI